MTGGLCRMRISSQRIFCAMLLTINPAQSMFARLEGTMTTTASKPLLTRADLPLDAIAEICRRWGVLELAIDTTESRPQPRPPEWLDRSPFELVDLYLIADFGPGEYDWGFKEHHFDVANDLYQLLGSQVWIDDKDILKSHVGRGAEWAKQEMEERDVIYPAR